MQADIPPQHEQITPQAATVTPSPCPTSRQSASFSRDSWHEKPVSHTHFSLRTQRDNALRNMWATFFACAT